MEEVLSFAFPADKFALGSAGVGSVPSQVMSPEEKLAAAVAKAVTEALKG